MKAIRAYIECNISTHHNFFKSIKRLQIKKDMLTNNYFNTLYNSSNTVYKI